MPSALKEILDFNLLELISSINHPVVLEPTFSLLPIPEPKIQPCRHNKTLDPKTSSKSWNCCVKCDLSELHRSFRCMKGCDLTFDMSSNKNANLSPIQGTLWAAQHRGRYMYSSNLHDSIGHFYKIQWCESP